MKKRRKFTEKGRLKRRIQAYENFFNLFGCMLETDFECIFNRMAQKKGIERRRTVQYEPPWDIRSIIEACDEEECLELNRRLDCYQIDKTIE